MSFNIKLPHTGKMVLIDKIESVGENFIITKSIIKEDNAFLDNGVFYTYKTVEIMAQSLGAFKGVYAKDDFALGFLLGVREFEILTPFLNIGDELTINSQISMQDESGFGVWSSQIFVKKNLVAKATLSVLSPQKQMFLEIKNG
ncbi:thioester dehydrase [Campylobacter sp. 9BO]|uniref:ApeP family dehydratase n=1 Tax=Campylobacter sp. 9BO TaxID=3424759 RepID=UPI003D32DEB8